MNTRQLGVLARDGWYVLAATTLMTLQPLLTSLTRNADGGYDYLAVSTTFIVEIIKFLISLSFYFALPAASRSHQWLTRWDVLQFATPAFIYFVNNNMIFIILYYVDSVTYQILSSLKTVATGILFRLVLKRVLSEVQIIAILLLTCGAANSQVPTGVATTCDEMSPLLLDGNVTYDSADSPTVQEPGIRSAELAWIGVLAALVACLLSALGGVYSEKLLKKDGQMHSIHLQNMLLYSWGILFNGFALVTRDGARVYQMGLMHGYSGVVWVMLTNNAFNGLAISAILKYADNIVRVFAHAAAMMLTLAIEVAFMGHAASVQLFISIATVGLSTLLYSRTPPPRPAVTTTFSALPDEKSAAGRGARVVPSEEKGMLDADTDEGKEVLVESAPGPEFVRITVGGKGIPLGITPASEGEDVTDASTEGKAGPSHLVAGEVDAAVAKVEAQ